MSRLKSQAVSLYGTPQPLSAQNPSPIVSTRNPSTLDTGYAIGQNWVNRLTQGVFELGGYVAGAAIWVVLGGASADVNTLSGDAGGNLSPTAGNITLAGGTNIGTTGAGSTVTVNLDSAITLTSVATDVAAAGMTVSGNSIIADGTDAAIDITLTPKGIGVLNVSNGNLVVATGNITATLGDITATAGDLVATAGDVNVTAGDVNVTAGDVTVTAGDLELVAGSVVLPGANIIESVVGFPTGAVPAGTLAIRTNGTTADGVLYVNNTGGATGWRPVLRANTTWIEHFTQSPVLQSNVNTGAAPTGATGDVNLMCLQGGEIMQQFIIGAGQTIIAPRMDAIGLLVSLDLTNTEGAEYNWGMTPISKNAVTVGTSPAFAFIMSFAVADVTGANPILMGFRKQAANNGTYTNYTDYAAIGLNNTANPGTVIIEDRLNSGVAVQTNTTDAWADGANHTLRINVSAAGVVTYSIDAAAPTVTHAFTFDNGDVISPFFHFVHGAVAPGAIEWTDMVCGPQ